VASTRAGSPRSVQMVPVIGSTTSRSGNRCRTSREKSAGSRPQNDQVRASRHRLHRAFHSRHEPGIVVDVVIAWHNRDRAPRRDGSQTVQRVENRRGGPATERLLDHVASRKLGKRRRVIRLVLARHDDNGAVRCDERGGSPAGLVEERLGADDGAVLLGPVVSNELASERPQAFSVSAGEDDCAMFRCLLLRRRTLASTTVKDLGLCQRWPP